MLLCYSKLAESVMCYWKSISILLSKLY